MRFRTILRLAAATILFAACQSDSYKISGTAEGMADGDTIHLITDRIEGKPMMSTVVKDGRFELAGKVDSMTMCIVCSAKDQSVAQAFFLEPGSIDVRLSQVPGASRVSGTKVNDALQALNDSAFAFQKKGEQLYARLGLEPGTPPTAEQSQIIEKELQKGYTSLTQYLYDTARKNIDNELGYLLTTDYNGITDELRLTLINNMPKRFRLRPDVKELEAALKQGTPTSDNQQ